MSLLERLAEHAVVVRDDGAKEDLRAVFQDAHNIIVPSPKIVLRAGDEIHRVLPNGHQETWVVEEPLFRQALGSIKEHYHLAVRRKGAATKSASGGLNIHVGDNSHVNIASTDNSVNVKMDVASAPIWDELRRAAREKLNDGAMQAQILQKIDAMAAAQDRKTLMQRYTAFVESAAAHMTVFAPFLPGLALLVSNAAS